MLGKKICENQSQKIRENRADKNPRVFWIGRVSRLSMTYVDLSTTRIFRKKDVAEGQLYMYN
jgi:hypothetical protein